MKKKLTILLIAYLFSCGQASPPVSEAPGSVISIPVKNLSEKKPVFYKTIIDKTSIEFFVVMINNEVSSYLNRCKKCFNSGKGFSFEKEHIKCRACNVSFQMENILTGVGSCYPIRVAGSIKDTSYIINSASLRSAYFDRKPGL